MTKNLGHKSQNEIDYEQVFTIYGIRIEDEHLQKFPVLKLKTE